MRTLSSFLTLAGLPSLRTRLPHGLAATPAGAPATGRAALAICWTAACGTALQLRPVCPQDAALLGAFFEGLSSQSRRQRFHAAVRRLPQSRLDWLAQADSRDRGCYLVVHQQGGRSVAIAEGLWARSAAAGTAEFALCVADAWQRQGVGRRMLRCLADAASSQGLASLHGDVLPGNLPMQALAGSLQFTCQPHPDEPGVLRIERLLCSTRPGGPARWATRTASRLADCLAPWMAVRLGSHQAAPSTAPVECP